MANIEKAGEIKVTLIKSTIGSTPYQKKVVASLGLKKPNGFKIHPDNVCINGMVRKISHLVKVEKIG